MKKILLWGWFGFENLGDDLLLKTMLDNISGDITIPMNVQYELPSNIKQTSRNYLQLLLGASQQDVLIVGPGGLFPFDNSFKVLLYYMITKIWKVKKRKVIYFGVGISERMGNYSAVLWRKIAQSADLFMPRSAKVLDRLEIQKTEKVNFMADAVFASKVLLQDIDQPKLNRVIISVANLQEKVEDTFNQVVAVWIQVINSLLNKGLEVDLIAFTKGRDDRMIDAIISSPKIQGGVHPVHYTDAAHTVDSWKKYQFAICMRFHALVLSTLAGVPAIPIAYGHKTYSLAAKCGLEKYTLIWNNFQSEYYGQNIEISSEQIIEKIKLLCEDMDDVKIKMPEHRKMLVDSACEAFAYLKTVLAE